MPISKKSLKNLKKGKQFSSDYQPKERGRRKNRLREFIDDDRVSLNDLRIILENLVTSYTFTEIEDLYNKGRDDLPILVAMFLKSFIVDVKKGSLTSIEVIMDRVYGKATQTTMVEVHDVPEEAKRRMASIFDKAKQKSSKIKPKNIVAKKEQSLEDEDG
jgi:dephospho-CoA kinase